MHVPMDPSAPHQGNLIPLSQPEIHCHMHCTEETRPLHMCVVCLRGEYVCVCMCVWGRDVEGQVEKWMHSLCIQQPGVSIKLTVAQQLINPQYFNANNKRSISICMCVWSCTDGQSDGVSG